MASPRCSTDAPYDDYKSKYGTHPSITVAGVELEGTIWWGLGLIRPDIIHFLSGVDKRVKGK